MEHKIECLGCEKEIKSDEVVFIDGYIYCQECSGELGRWIENEGM